MTSAEPKRARFIGTCRGCRATVRLELEHVSTRTVKSFRSTDHFPIWRFPDGETREGSSEHVYRTCLWCGRHVEFKRLRGRRSEQKCGARCLSSKGPSCECACGGENHGAAHAI